MEHQFGGKQITEEKDEKIKDDGRKLFFIFFLRNKRNKKSFMKEKKKFVISTRTMKNVSNLSNTN